MGLLIAKKVKGREKRAARLARRQAELVHALRAPCGCVECVGEKRWPAYYVGSDERRRAGILLSYECYVEAIEVPDQGEPQKITRAEAKMVGLHVRRRKRRWLSDVVGVMVDGCRGCGGLRPVGFLYCRACARAYLTSEREKATA